MWWCLPVTQAFRRKRQGHPGVWGQSVLHETVSKAKNKKKYSNRPYKQKARQTNVVHSLKQHSLDHCHFWFQLKKKKTVGIFYIENVSRWRHSVCQNLCAVTLSMPSSSWCVWHIAHPPGDTFLTIFMGRCLPEYYSQTHWHGKVR